MKHFGLTIFALLGLLVGSNSLLGVESVVRPRSKNDFEKSTVTFNARVGNRFGIRFAVEGRVVEVPPNIDQKRGRSFRFFAKDSKPDPNDFENSIEVKILSRSLYEAFAADLKRHPNLLFRFTVYETVYKDGATGEAEYDLDDQPPGGPGWNLEQVLILCGYRAAGSTEKGVTR